MALRDSTLAGKARYRVLRQSVPTDRAMVFLDVLRFLLDRGGIDNED